MPLGEIQRDAGQSSSARAFQERAVKIYEALVARDGDRPEYRFGHALSLSRLASLRSTRFRAG